MLGEACDGVENWVDDATNGGQGLRWKLGKAYER